MATELQVHIKKAPYRGFEARFFWQGMLCRYAFDSQQQLAAKMADDCIDDRTIEMVMDVCEQWEWVSDEPYPLLADFAPLADCDCEMCRSFPVRDHADDVRRSLYPWTLAFLTCVVAWLVVTR